MHPNVERVMSALRANGASGDVVELPERASTAASAAAQLGCDVGAIANSLVFRADDEPLLILTSGAHRVDTDDVAGRLGYDRVSRADPEFVRQMTGQVIGGVAPLGHPAPIRTVVDIELANYPEIWAAAGAVDAVFRTSYAELLSLTSGTALKVAE